MKINDQSSDQFIDICELMQSIKEFHDIPLWEAIKVKQIKELGGICAYFLNDTEFDIGKVEDKKMVLAIEKIISINPKAKDASYLEKLQNYRDICESIYDRAYNHNAFLAGLFAQIEFAFKLKKSKRLNSVRIGDNLENSKDITDGGHDKTLNKNCISQAFRKPIFNS